MNNELEKAFAALRKKYGTHCAAAEHLGIYSITTAGFVTANIPSAPPTTSSSLREVLVEDARSLRSAQQRLPYRTNLRSCPPVSDSRASPCRPFNGGILRHIAGVASVQRCGHERRDNGDKQAATFWRDVGSE